MNNISKGNCDLSIDLSSGKTIVLVIMLTKYNNKNIQLFLKQQIRKKTDNKDVDNKKILLKFPEEPTTCCMSGCANCVWLDYAEKLNNYFKDGGEKALKEIDKHVTDANIKAFLKSEIKMRLMMNDKK